MRLKILFGTLVLVVGLAVYALVIAALAGRFMPEHWAVQALFYCIAGIAWVWPAARLVRWMQSGN
jgi:uncharacterized protein DUF2842